MWPVLSSVCETYQRDVRVMERCCRCIRFAVRCVGKHSAHLLEPIVKQVLTLECNNDMPTTHFFKYI